ncbi:four helix bundle protein [Candidatus Gottesmanbacteria bacterium]|nr:four helix bundle protein [Candidatus Gottesmanbacteria bacterium]MBI3560064.1 four helix bundle protein [Candidatus Gottesmanbacteria bacterium]
MADRFENLEVFKESHKFVLLIYKVTLKFSNDEKYGLTSQLRRAVISIVANIVEGNARGHSREFVQFLYQSIGSLEEVKYYILLAKDLGYLTRNDYDKLHNQAEIVGRLLSGLMKYWKQKSLKS